MQKSTFFFDCGTKIENYDHGTTKYMQKNISLSRSFFFLFDIWLASLFFILSEHQKKLLFQASVLQKVKITTAFFSLRTE